MMDQHPDTKIEAIQIYKSRKSLAKVLLDVIPIRQFGIALSCSSTVQDQGADTPALAWAPLFGGWSLMVTTI